MEPSHGGQQKRHGAGFRGRGGCGDQGHRRGSADIGFRDPGTADSGTAGGKNRASALFAGTELEHHRADEHPAGGSADLGAVGAAAGGGA